MSNPYDEYDPVDLWDEDDPEEEGNFDYVDDDTFPDVDTSENPQDTMGWEYPQSTPSPSDSLPKTMVRKRPLVDQGTFDRQPSITDKPRILRRRPKRQESREEYDDRFAESPPQAAPYEAPRPQRPQRPPRQRRPRRRGRHGCLVTILIFIALSIGIYWVVAHPIDERLAFTPQEQRTVDGTLSWSVPGAPYYVLALGSDQQEGDTYSRSDTMILVRVDLIGGKLTMLSIPRDTRVEIEGHGMQKINAAYAFDGAGGAVRAVSKLTGVGIQHVAVIHIEELAGLVDYLGGVTVNVPVAAYDPEHSGADIEAGTQTLDGETAVAWARTRYGFERGDFQRQEDQRLLINAIVNRMLSLSPKQMPGALERLGDLVGTDMRCYNLAPLIIRFKLSNPIVYSASVPSTTDTIDGVSYVIANETELKTMMGIINSGGNPGEMLN